MLNLRKCCLQGQWRGLAIRPALVRCCLNAELCSPGPGDAHWNEAGNSTPGSWTGDAAALRFSYAEPPLLLGSQLLCA